MSKNRNLSIVVMTIYYYKETNVYGNYNLPYIRTEDEAVVHDNLFMTQATTTADDS